MAIQFPNFDLLEALLPGAVCSGRICLLFSGLFTFLIGLFGSQHSLLGPARVFCAARFALLSVFVLVWLAIR